ncbi:uncharacterized protein LOC114535147 [Dendronephthya gigantea]|uniref:uncharacterized protein LOC114535147 n=1 Tax=Dendronephthya gigantea TaxID=151771 RepID=UPI00106B6E3D|nr:uncharacterized protein LOC114535147 [Dendronephthya gigantea]
MKEEKKRMQAIVVTDDNIIRLNVGGQKFTTKRSTLCQVEGSLFATMFSSDWEDSVERDQDGAVFFDFNPQYFVYILDYLRGRKIATPENPPPLPKVPEEHVENFRSLVEYLGFSHEIFPTKIVTDEKFNLHSSGVTLEEDGKVAVHDGTKEHNYIFSEKIYQQGFAIIKLQLELINNDYWVFIGIVEGDVVPQDDDAYEWRSSYGWGLGSSPGRGVFKEGSYTKDNTLSALTKQDVNELKLVVDCNAAKLLLISRNGHKFHVDIPENKTWRLYINMVGSLHKIRLIQ